MKRIALSLVMIMAALAAFADIYVVSSEKAQVYEADDESAETIGSLRKGMEINVSKVESGFCEIDFMGVKGFVSINDLKFKSCSGKNAKSASDADSQAEDQNLGEKTKDFVSNTSKKVANGVSGLKNKFFGNRKDKHDGEVAEDADESTEPEPARTAPESAASEIRQGGEQGKNVENYRAAADATEVSEEGSAGVIYLFDNHKFICSQVQLNGNLLPLPEPVILKSGNGKTFDTYKRTVTKIVVKNPERIILTRDFTWFEKPYHDELILDVADGDVYYIELISGMSSKLNLMNTQKGAQKLEKVKKDTKNWTVNPDQYYDK